jgi:hypothetical protein
VLGIFLATVGRIELRYPELIRRNGRWPPRPLSPAETEQA